MSEIIVTKLTLKAVLAALIAVDGELEGLAVMLWSANIVPDENTVYADLTPCVFSGYAPVTVTAWNAPYLDAQSQKWALKLDAVEFRSTNPGTYVPDVAYGCALYLPGAPAVLKGVERFDAPFTFDVPDRLLTLSVVLPGSAVLES